MFFFSSRRRHTRSLRDWSSDVCSSDLDNIGARWTGKIFVSNAGLTQFFTRSDDGSMIFIDGQQVVDNNFFQGETERSGLIDLSAGFHDITLLFYEGGGNAGFTASWVPVGGSK